MKRRKFNPNVKPFSKATYELRVKLSERLGRGTNSQTLLGLRQLLNKYNREFGTQFTTKKSIGPAQYAHLLQFFGIQDYPEKELNEITNFNSKKKRKQRQDFFKTPEWQQLRYKILIKYGRKCMCCGAEPKDGVQLHVDHIKPRSKYPELELDEGNLQVLCEDCNMGKSNIYQHDFREDTVH